MGIDGAEKPLRIYVSQIRTAARENRTYANKFPGKERTA